MIPLMLILLLFSILPFGVRRYRSFPGLFPPQTNMSTYGGDKFFYSPRGYVPSLKVICLAYVRGQMHPKKDFYNMKKIDNWNRTVAEMLTYAGLEQPEWAMACAGYHGCLEAVMWFTYCGAHNWQLLGEHAARGGHFDIIRRLPRGKLYMQLLLPHAAEENRFEILLYLFDHVEISDWVLIGALEYACAGGHFESVKVLVTYGKVDKWKMLATLRLLRGRPNDWLIRRFMRSFLNSNQP